MHHRRQVEGPGFDDALLDPEDHDPAQIALGTVRPMTSHGDFGPDPRAFLAERTLLEDEIRQLRENVRPVPANLIGATEAPIGPTGILQHVVGREVSDDAIKIVRGGGAMQASHDVTR